MTGINETGGPDCIDQVVQIMARIELTEQFYEDEVREGFYIPACVKQAWGAQIRVLNDVDKVCTELGIKYFADWGTFLGAVRHGGFVPWDDDFDICMLRDDYNRFLEEGVSRLPEGYAVFNLKTKEDHEQFVANIVSRTRICFEQEHLARFHGFPYISAVDVFLIDYMAPDKDRQEAMKAKAQYILRVSDEIRKTNLEGSRLKERLKELERLLKIHIPAGLDRQQIRQFLDVEAEKLFASFVDEKDDADRIVQMMPWGLKDAKIMPKQYYAETIDIPFETGTMPVPIIYDDALRVHYGDYMQLYKNAGGHDYPFFAKSRAQLQEVLDFELPEYRVDTEELLRKADERCNGNIGLQAENTYRSIVNECLDEMERLSGSLTKEEALEAAIDMCGQLQQLAIDLGTYMETVKGEGYDIVALLENYCEALYELTIADTVEDMKAECGRVCGLFKEAADRVRSRKEVLFLPFKGEYWEVFEDEYKKAEDDPDTDVYIVPIPYYYKDYMGRLHDMQYDTGSYPEELKLTHYDDYDYAVHHPDVIMIQNPYDGYNDEMSVPPFFYSDKLLELTDSLVYIPWFRTDDFTRENEREYINMKYYCTMPGVINADRVILQSETIRNTYIEKLCDFAGEKSRGLWEKKLTATDSEGPGDAPGADERSDRKKVLLYYVDFSDVLKRGQQAIDKMETVLTTFTDNAGSLDYLILKGRLIDNKLKYCDEPLYSRYVSAIEKSLGIAQGSIRVIEEDETDYDTLVQSCSAYYGDAGHLAHMFRNAGKPVMIQNYDI